MPSVQSKEREHFHLTLRRFKRACEKAGIVAEVKRREYFEKPTWARKRKAAAAVKRQHKQIKLANPTFSPIR